ncbi:MAG: NlpC/P60 family protein [Anaerolineales bacterium]|jgi:cell wall-associated NlpC family hydrolase|nr:NlpC/P60 family protein [Anaerolineales bacterium]
MPFVEVNGIQIHYQSLGSDQHGKAPVVLIYDPAEGRQADWEMLASWLANSYPIIIPEYRRHGPGGLPLPEHSILQHAEDTAALLTSLGFARANIIGVCTGLNTALAFLLGHPELVQSAVLYAANGPNNQDATEEKPHYTAADLARVEQPVLVITGKGDTPNSSARLARFAAEHIPYAELWQADGADLNVRGANAMRWLPRVLDFLDRRGSTAGEALYRLKRTGYPDERETIFEPRIEEKEGSLYLAGEVLTEENALAARCAVSQAALPGQPVQDELHVLLTSDSPWALICRGVTDLRREPRNLSERVSQVLFGEAVRVLKFSDPPGGWAKIRLESDGYMGWVHQKALVLCNAAEAAAYHSACNALIIANLAEVHHTYPGNSLLPGGKAPGKLPFGAHVAVISEPGAWLEIRQPDGHSAWLRREEVMLYTERPRPDASGIQAALALIRRFAGVPYLWGGRTPFGYDCSGLAQAFYAFLGAQIPRDADQQYRAGQPVEGLPQPGDLIFFGEPAERAQARFASITHVGVVLKDWQIIHANGTAWSISFEDLADETDPYATWLREHNLGVRRYLRGIL